MKFYITLIILSFSCAVVAQSDTGYIPTKPSAIQVIELEKRQANPNKVGKTNFEHWMYSEKTHALVGYLGSIVQGGFSNGKSTSTWHYDLGALYMGKWVKTKNYKLNVHGWVEHTNLLYGSDPKTFAKDLDMFSVPNANDETSSGIALEYLHIEQFFFDGFWDVTIGKMEPTFYMTFTPYSAWDKLTLFNKSASSDPVPDMDGAFGVFTEFNFSPYLSIGGQVLDDNPTNDILDIGNFFGNTTYNYQAFVRWAIPTQHNHYSYHLLDFYTYPVSGSKTSGNGWLYVGNQGVSENLILTLKLSQGSGRVLKYNGAYAAGCIYKNPFKRLGDQTGFSLMVNEVNSEYEYGIDTFYKLFLKNWITAAASVQGYYTKNKQFAVVPGVRLMMTY